MTGNYSKDLNVYLTDKPLAFEFDPDTGLVGVRFLASFGKPNSDENVEYPLSLILTPKASLALLQDLPILEAILLKAKQGKTTPRSVQ